QIIARHFYTVNPSGLTAAQIQQLLQHEFSAPQREEMDAHIRDFLSCSFLNREGDQYRFSHRSIMEYLAARDLSGEINSDTPQVFREFKLTPTVRDFLLDLRGDPPGSWQATLRKWIESTRGQSEAQAGYLGGNSITLLNAMGESFAGED